MEQKAKRIGKFNVVDIIAVVLILAVLAFVGYKLLGPDDAAPPTQEKVKVTYTVRVERVADELYENCLPYLPSKLMASGKLVGGQIESVEKEPCLVLAENGTWAEDPDHVNLLFTCTTEVSADAVMTTKVGEQEVRVGKTSHILKSEYIEFGGCTIVDVKWGE